MSDARWIDVEDDVAQAAEHFRNARALYAARRAEAATLDEYRDKMALMHALQSAHTSAEAALTRILRILGEEPPTGEDWHRRLIDRLAKPLNGGHARPALLSPAVAADLDETRRFRNRAVRSYGAFQLDRVGPTMEAASRLETSFAMDVERFRRSLDPA